MSENQTPPSATQEETIDFEGLLQTVMCYNLHDRAKTLGASIDDELDSVLSKVNEYKRGGEINIKLKIKQGDRQQLNIVAEVTSKSPKGSINQNIFYQDNKDGKLFLDDPNQLKIVKVPRIHSYLS